jgi:repressor LexA
MADKQTEPMTEIVYAFIRLYLDRHGYAPSLRDISTSCYLGRSTVIHHLDQLEAQGRISREPGRARSIVVLDLEKA